MPLDVAFLLREGRDITLISWGAMVKEASLRRGTGRRGHRSRSSRSRHPQAIRRGDSLIRHQNGLLRGFLHEAARTAGFGARDGPGERALLSLLRRSRASPATIPSFLSRLEQHYMPSVGVSSLLRVSSAELERHMRQFNLRPRWRKPRRRLARERGRVDVVVELAASGGDR